MSAPETIDGHAEEIGTALVQAPPTAAVAPATLFRTDDPAVVLERATETANALKGVLDQQGLTANIRGKKHVIVEGWQTVGAMLGVTPVCDWTRPISEPSRGWEARVEARTLDGRVIGAAEAMCVRGEGKWANSDEYAIRSMAQTRATSKALASVLRFIVTLAGYSGTPAEEIEDDAPAEKPIDVGPKIPNEQVRKIGAAVGTLQVSYKEVHHIFGAAGANGLTAESGEALRQALEGLNLDQAVKFEAQLERIAKDRGVDELWPPPAPDDSQRDGGQG